MANIKITDLTAYGDPASTDVLPIVDIGADVTKKVSVGDLLENAGSGTAALPGIAFDGDPNTGIYRPGADQLAISTNGTERVLVGSSQVVFNDGGANYDFRIKGDTNSSLFFIDASENAVGIGTTSPGSALEIDAAAATSPFIAKINTSEAARIDSSGRLLVGASSALAVGGSQHILQTESTATTTVHCASFIRHGGMQAIAGSAISLARTRGTSPGAVTAVANGDSLGYIIFSGANGTDISNNAAWIRCDVDGDPFTSGDTTDLPGRLVFSTTADGAAGPTERMRIKSNGTINFSNVSVYADNAAAKTGGLVDGDVYRTSTGDLKIVYS